MSHFHKILGLNKHLIYLQKRYAILKYDENLIYAKFLFHVSCIQYSNFIKVLLFESILINKKNKKNKIFKNNFHSENLTTFFFFN